MQICLLIAHGKLVQKPGKMQIVSSFEDFNSIEYETSKAACAAHRYLADDNEWKERLRESADSYKQILITLFAFVIVKYLQAA